MELLRVERHEDMSPLGRLAVLVQEDGDVIVAVLPDPDTGDHSVEFCNPAGGGGRSPHTRRALGFLLRAMERDNRERPVGTHPFQGRPVQPHLEYSRDERLRTRAETMDCRADSCAAGDDPPLHCRPGFCPQDCVYDERRHLGPNPLPALPGRRERLLEQFARAQLAWEAELLGSDSAWFDAMPEGLMQSFERLQALRNEALEE